MIDEDTTVLLASVHVDRCTHPTHMCTRHIHTHTINECKFKECFINLKDGWAGLAHAFDPSTQEEEAGGSL